MKQVRAIAGLITVCLALPIVAQAPQERVDLDAIYKIKDEGLNRSQVMDSLSYLTDVYGGRLTGSPQIKAAAEWAKKNNRPVYLGEFGAFEKADMESRAKWTAAVVKEAEARGFSWAYWEFAAGFGAYDRDKKAWREPLMKALIPK